MAKKRISAAVVIYLPASTNDTISNECTGITVTQGREDLDSSGLSDVVNQHTAGGFDLSGGVEFKFDDDLTHHKRVVDDCRAGAERVYRFKMSDAVAATTNFWWDFKFVCLAAPLEFQREQLLTMSVDWPINNMAYDAGAGFVYWTGSAI